MRSSACSTALARLVDKAGLNDFPARSEVSLFVVQEKQAQFSFTPFSVVSGCSVGALLVRMGDGFGTSPAARRSDSIDRQFSFAGISRILHGCIPYSGWTSDQNQA
jgi:hypothetical protein